MAWPKQALTPVLFGLLPSLTLLSMNIESIAPVYALRPALFLSAVALVAYLLAARLWHDATRAAVGVALVVLLSTHSIMGESILRAANWAPARILAPVAQGLWILAMLLGLGLVIVRKSLPDRLGSSMLMVGVALLFVPAIQILAHENALRRPLVLPGALADMHSPPLPNERNPDIFYIILDGYGREDILRDLYGLDNSGFLSELEQRGFFVARKSQSNYAQTALSLASSLNMTDLSGVAALLGEHSKDQRLISRLLRHSALRAILEGQGYSVRSVSSGYRRTELEDAEIFLRPPIGALNGFETQLIESVGLSPLVRALLAVGWLSELPGYQDQRDRVSFAVSHLRPTPSDTRPQFVFAHIILPHPPFMWNADGEAASPDELFRWDDASAFPGTREEYVAGYREQLLYTNTLILREIDRILADPERPTVIVLQADHGPGSRLDWDDPEASYLPERMGILNAYYAPEATNAFYDSISPVNSFRVLLNSYFGYDLPLLPDRSWYSNWERPYTFIEVPNDRSN